MMPVIIVEAAHADPIDAEEDARVLREARRRARLGIVSMIAGPPMLVIGLGARGDAGGQVGALFLLSGLGGVVGGPLLLGTGGLRTQRLLADRGVDVRATMGRAALGTYVSSMALFATAIVLLGIGYGDPGGFYMAGASVTWLGSGVFGVAQLANNGNGRRELDLVIAPAWDDGPAFRVLAAW